MTYWFSIEPFVHISLKGSCALFYNTLTGCALEYRNNLTVLNLIKKLRRKNNLLVIKLSDADLRQPQIKTFVKKIRQTYCGDLIPANLSKGKPIELMPMLNVQRDIKKLIVDPSRSIGEDIMSYLSECSFYITNLNGELPAALRDAYKQFLFFTNSDDAKSELDINMIEKFLQESRGSYLRRINILGGDIFQYSRFKDLIKLLETMPIQKVYYACYLDADNHTSELNLLKGPLSEPAVLINFPLKIAALKNLVEQLAKNQIRTSFIFVVENETQVKDAGKLAKKFKMDDFSLQPYYNGGNIRFFKKNVFVSKKDIFQSKPSYKEIFSRMCMNPLKFGKLTIRSNGDIYADVNAQKLGRLGQDSLYDVVFKEMKSQKSWRKTRTSVEPCRRCLFDVLCPPLSNYEYELKRNNLCHIWNEKAYNIKKK